MFDAFPFDEWGEDIAEFWTFAGGDKIIWDQASLGTWLMTALGFTAMLLAFFGFVILENRKLTHQASRLKASGALDRPGPSTMGPAA